MDIDLIQHTLFVQDLEILAICRSEKLCLQK